MLKLIRLTWTRYHQVLKEFLIYKVKCKSGAEHELISLKSAQDVSVFSVISNVNLQRISRKINDTYMHLHVL